MPFYDYRCETCAKPARLFFSFAAYESADPACPHCGEKTLKRRIRRVVIAKSEEKRMDGMMDESMLGALENEDPREIGRFMRKMSHEMGEDLGDEFGEVVNRFECQERRDRRHRFQREEMHAGFIGDGFDIEIEHVARSF